MDEFHVVLLRQFYEARDTILQILKIGLSDSVHTSPALLKPQFFRTRIRLDRALNHRGLKKMLFWSESSRYKADSCKKKYYRFQKWTGHSGKNPQGEIGKPGVKERDGRDFPFHPPFPTPARACKNINRYTYISHFSLVFP